MTVAQPREARFAPAAIPEARLVETRFGAVAVAEDTVIRMPYGVLGFEDNHTYTLVPFPDASLGHFRLLQNIEEPSLSFVVLPLATDSGLIDPEDLEETCQVVGAGHEDVAVLLIVTVRKTDTGMSMTANLRAPIVLDARGMTARQCVLSNNKYSIRHAL